MFPISRLRPSFCLVLAWWSLALERNITFFNKSWYIVQIWVNKRGMAVIQIANVTWLCYVSDGKTSNLIVRYSAAHIRRPSSPLWKTLKHPRTTIVGITLPLLKHRRTNLIMSTAGLWATAGETPRCNLFRVHHADSGTLRSASNGFTTQYSDWLRSENEFYDTLLAHLDFNNDEPSPFISVTDSAEFAMERASKMRNRGYSDVRIIVIDPSAVGKKALNVRKAANYLDLYIPPRAYGYTAGERVYLRDIPGDAVVREYSNIGNFRRAFGGSWVTREFGVSWLEV